MKLVVLHGLPGVGKFTIGKELAEQTGYKLFHNHLTIDLLCAIFEFGSPPFIELREKTWSDVIRRAAKSDIPGLIFTYGWDRTVSSDFFVKLSNEVESNSGSVHYIELTCEPSELEKRIVEAERSKFHKVNDLDFFKSLVSKGFLVPLDTPRKGIAIDVTSVQPKEAAASICKQIGCC